MPLADSDPDRVQPAGRRPSAPATNEGDVGLQSTRAHHAGPRHLRDHRSPGRVHTHRSRASRGARVGCCGTCLDARGIAEEQRTDDPPVTKRSTKAYDAPSVFTAANLLREARRQRQLPHIAVPAVCLLDPDGDVVRHLRRAGRTERHPGWACYHSELWTTQVNGRTIGIVPCAVGGPYAVLVAEQLIESGCELLVSITSAGTVTPLGTPPYFVLIEQAWRDEGTSDHYLPPSEWANLNPRIAAALDGAFDAFPEPIHRGRSWTTDAPFRETQAALASAAAAGIHAVEMEAASLYAFATATGHDIVCIAHVTNTMAVHGDDFEKGEDDGTHRILALTAVIAEVLNLL